MQMLVGKMKRKVSSAELQYMGDRDQDACEAMWVAHTDDEIPHHTS
jgi:hypothetical protein